MKGCIYLFITRNVYRSWVLVPDMAILKGELVIFPFPAFAFGCWQHPNRL